MHTKRIEDGRTNQARKSTCVEDTGGGRKSRCDQISKDREYGWPATLWIVSEAQRLSKGQHFLDPSVYTHYSFATCSPGRKEEK